VAELLSIRHTVNLKQKCIVVLPFVSIVTEKTKHFRKILADEKVEIGCFHGGARAPELWDIAVCTIEKVRSPKEATLQKANSLINNMLEENSIDKLGAVVLDEMHMIGDPHRGYIMELVLTKILAVQMSIQVLSHPFKAHGRLLGCLLR
jgi:DNA polymerase theta